MKRDRAELQEELQNTEELLTASLIVNFLMTIAFLVIR